MSIRLSQIQQQIVQHDDGPLLVVAGPGSGKTRVLTERIRRLLREREGHFRVLALTFTNKAANEMKERLAEFSDINHRTFIGTLHSFCMEVLSNRGKTVGIDHLPNIFESNQDLKQVLLQAIMDDPELNLVLNRAGSSKDQSKLINIWLEMIRDAKGNLLPPEMIEDSIIRKLYSAYNAGLRASDAVDFDDLLFLTYRLFQERPKIANFYCRQYRYICIDEAQDLNEAQYQVLCALCGSDFSNVMMVGDPKQAIFVWNGANPKYLDLFQQDFGAKKIFLDENFRSSQVVVSMAKSLAPEYEVQGQLPIVGSCKLIVGEDEKQEAALVLDYIDDLVKNGHPDVEGPITLDRCSLLGRTRYVLSNAEQELDKRHWPHYKQLLPQQENESDLIKDMELCLKILANPRDRFHIGMLLKRWDISEDAIASIKHTNNYLSLFNDLKNKISNKDQLAVLNATELVNCTKQDFKFTNAMDYLNNYAEKKRNQEERALIMQDIRIWRNHYDAFLRSQQGGQHSLTSFLGIDAK